MTVYLGLFASSSGRRRDRGRLVCELKAKSEEKGEDTSEKRFAVAQQLKIGRFVLKINRDGPVVAGLTSGGSHESPSSPLGS